MAKEKNKEQAKMTRTQDVELGCMYTQEDA